MIRHVGKWYNPTFYFSVLARAIAESNSGATGLKSVPNILLYLMIFYYGVLN